MKIIYKITYPNGKIYVGLDETNSISYFGSPSGEIVAKDFSAKERLDFSVRREVLFSSEVMTGSEMRKKENELIVALRSNDPKVGYNQRPKLK